MEYFSLLIPILSWILLYKYLTTNNNIELELSYWAFGLIPFILSLLIIIITTFVSNQNLMSDNEYRSSIVKSATYYEYWETWKVETCSRQVACGEDCSTDSQGKQSCVTKYCTEYYDCSYCQHNGEYYQATDEINNVYSITKNEYYYLKDKWNSISKFIELNRDINRNYGCGIDGDAYNVNWDGNIHKTETYNWIGSFTNRTRLDKSAFKYLNITDVEADSIGLYHYPNITSDLKQDYILGLDKINKVYDKSTLDSIINLYKHLNGSLGPKNKVHVFVLLFHNGISQDIALKQEAYWEGGNQNEIVICIGLNKYNFLKPDWVKAFSWTDNKKTLIDIREHIMEEDTLDFFKNYDIIRNAIIKDNYHYKNLDKDFDYLEADLTNNIILLIYVLVLLFNICFVVFFIKNND